MTANPMPFAVRLSFALKHGSDVRGAGGVSEHRRLKVLGRESVADRQAEHIDDFIHVRADEMRTENAFARLLHEDLEAISGLGYPARRISLRCLLTLHAELETALACLCLTQSDRGDRRYREGDTRHAKVVWPVVVALQ